MTGILLSIDPKHYTYRNWQPCQKEQHEQTKPLKRFSCSLCLYLFVFFKADEDNSLSFYPLLCLLARATVTAHLSQLFQLKCRRSRFLYGYYSVSRQRQTCMRAAWGCSFASQICRQKWKWNFEHWFVDIICLSHGSCSLNGMWRVMSCGDWHMTVTEWHMTDLTFFQAKNTVNIVDGCCFCTQISYKQQADDTRDVSCSSIISSSNLRQTFEMSQKKKNKRKCKY